jgi:Fe-S cluster biosynthesis and repair protein YggX
MDQFIDHVWELVVEEQQLEEELEKKDQESLLGGFGQRSWRRRSKSCWEDWVRESVGDI